MSSLITAFLECIKAGLNIKLEAEATKYIDEMIEIQKQIKAEEDKGYESNDAKIESLYGDLRIIIDVATAQFKNLNVQNTPSA